jgi:hypothetical protein
MSAITDELALYGFVQQHVGNGEFTCYGGERNHVIARGAQVWWRQTSHEYDDWESYCRRHALAYARQDYSDIATPRALTTGEQPK